MLRKRDYDWLDGNEKLFADSTLIELNSDIKFNHSLIFYAYGYRRSAEMLFDAISQGGYADSQYFALAFLWRQAIELLLKALIEDLDALYDANRWPGPARTYNRARDAGFLPPIAGHHLLRLWAEVEPRLRQIFPNEPETDCIGRVIAQFHVVDPGAEEFRYPTRMKDGTDTLSKLPRLVNLAELNAIMQGLWNVLEAAAAGVQARLDCKNEQAFALP